MTKNQKILLVDDDDFLLNMLNVKLINEGFETELAENGQVAMDKLKTFTPNLIILGLVMPVKNGFEVLEDLSKDKKLKKIPVIVLTNLAQDSDKEKAHQYGIQEYIVKTDMPIHGVVDRVKELCSKGKDCRKK